MRKFISIVFLVILLLNVYGYRLVIMGLRQQQSASMEATIDGANYEEADLISIKTKLNLPYYSSSKEFERVYGSVNVNGVEYEYVKRRVYQDTLELLCLPDKAKTALLSATYELDKLTIGIPSTHKKNAQVVKISFPDFFQELSSFTPLVLTEVQKSFSTTNHLALPASFAWSTDRPPQSLQFSA